jgi:hypothetical protein
MTFHKYAEEYIRDDFTYDLRTTRLIVSVVAVEIRRPHSLHENGKESKCTTLWLRTTAEKIACVE